MKPELAILLVVGLLMAADAPKTDQDLIQGKWEVFSGDTEGVQVPAEEKGMLKLTFKDNKITTEKPDATGNGTFNLDVTKEPKSIEFTFEKEAYRGIYSVVGDELKICVLHPDSKAELPTEFASKRGSMSSLLVFKRVKP